MVTYDREGRPVFHGVPERDLIPPDGRRALPAPRRPAAAVRRAPTSRVAPVAVRVCAPCLGLPPAPGEYRCGPCAGRIAARVQAMRQGLRLVV